MRSVPVWSVALVVSVLGCTSSAIAPESGSGSAGDGAFASTSSGGGPSDSGNAVSDAGALASSACDVLMPARIGTPATYVMAGPRELAASAVDGKGDAVVRVTGVTSAVSFSIFGLDGGTVVPVMQGLFGSDNGSSEGYAGDRREIVGIGGGYGGTFFSFIDPSTGIIENHSCKSTDPDTCRQGIDVVRTGGVVTVEGLPFGDGGSVQVLRHYFGIDAGFSETPLLSDVLRGQPFVTTRGEILVLQDVGE